MSINKKCQDSLLPNPYFANMFTLTGSYTVSVVEASLLNNPRINRPPAGFSRFEFDDSNLFSCRTCLLYRVFIQEW